MEGALRRRRLAVWAVRRGRSGSGIAFMDMEARRQVSARGVRCTRAQNDVDLYVAAESSEGRRRT